jgi:hypothetical protein
MESSTINGIVLHIHLQRQDRKNNSLEESTDFDNIVKFCSGKVIEYGGVISEVSNNAVIGIFTESDNGSSAELRAAECADMAREEICKHRDESKPYVMMACINSGSVIIGSALGENSHEVMGNGISASFQLLNTTQPMQISLTRRVKEKLEDVYSFVPRLPIYFGQKKALIFYLHRRLK